MRKLPLFMVCLGALLPVASPVLAQQESEASTGKAMIEAACRDKDFAGFFEGFSRASWPERQAYLAPSIRVVKNGKARMVPRAAYTGYDIMLVDYSYATASSFTLFEAGKRADFEKLRIMPSPFPRAIIAWTGAAAHLRSRERMRRKKVLSAALALRKAIASAKPQAAGNWSKTAPARPRAEYHFPLNRRLYAP